MQKERDSSFSVKCIPIALQQEALEGWWESQKSTLVHAFYDENRRCSGSPFSILRTAVFHQHWMDRGSNDTSQKIHKKTESTFCAIYLGNFTEKDQNIEKIHQLNLVCQKKSSISFFSTVNSIRCLGPGVGSFRNSNSPPSILFTKKCGIPILASILASFSPKPLTFSPQASFITFPCQNSHHIV